MSTKRMIEQLVFVDAPELNLTNYVSGTLWGNWICGLNLMANLPKQVPVEECHVVSQFLCAEHFDVSIDSLGCLFLFRQACLKFVYLL